MRRIGFAVPLAVALAFVTSADAGADTLIAAADAQTSSAQPTLRFGALPVMAVRHAARGSVLGSYIRFDVSSLQSEPPVQSAVLRLWVRSVVTPGTVEVAPILSPWQEATITAGSGPELGGSVAVFAVDERHISQFVEVDVTSLVRDWASGALENHGLALRADEVVNATFHTREGSLTSHVPSLELVRGEGSGVPVPAGPVAPPEVTPRLPAGSVMFFDLAACPQGWSPLVEARGRAIVGLNPGGTLRGGWPTTPGGLADQTPRTISGPSAVPTHTHAVVNAPEAAHTHAVTLSSEAAHTHAVTLAAESAHTHAVDLPAFTTSGTDGAHTHTTDTTGSTHSHSLDLGNGDDNTTDRAQFSESSFVVFSINTSSGGSHTHGVTNVGSTHGHMVDPPALPASGPGTSHTHAATAGAGSSHTHTAVAGAGSSHTHAGTANATGNATVDVTLPYVQLLVCRKD